MNLDNSLNENYRKIRIKILLLCVAVSSVVCVSQIRGSGILIIFSLLAFLILVVSSDKHNLAMPVLLYFLPWSTLLKTNIGSISFFTIALLITCIYALVRNKFKVKLYQIILPSVIFILTLISKGIFNNRITNDYLFFLIMLAVFPCVIKQGRNLADFKTLTIYFAVGIITAALSAQQVAGYPNISKYIKVDAYLNITRLSGYYSDPNFYSAHITACLAGVLVLLVRNSDRLERLFLMGIAFLLVYCGLLSASKSFVIVTATLFFVWVPLLQTGRNNGKWSILIGLIAAVIVVISSNMFQELLDVIDTRFSASATMSDFTTGRTELWKNYYREFMSNPVLLLFGEGYSNVTVNTRASHNTIIQGIFQFGLIGLPFLVLWVIKTKRNMFSEPENIYINRGYELLMAVGVALPWMAIDILFFDEFFLLIPYAIAGTIYEKRKKNEFE